jgi:hypothetical protein
MDDCPIADCVTALQRAIFARDMNTLFWWLQQLPFPAEHARHSAECFRFLASYTRELNPLLHAAYHQAISRELRQQTLGLDDDLFLVNSLCDELAIFRDDRCVAVLKEIATADFPALQQALLARALALSARKDSCSQRISVLLFRFLFAGGLFPDDALIATLAGHPAVLRFVLKQLLLAIERAHPREQADALIAGLVAPFRYDAKVIKAVLACARPPPEAVSPIAALLRGGSLPRPSVAAIVSESATVLQTGLATVAGLVALARTCGSFTADTAPRFVKFFRDSAAADLEAVPPAELKALVRDLCACGAGVGFDVATAVLGKAPAVADEVAAFMTEAESMQHFARWCATFPLVFPHLPPARQQDLLRFLDAQTVNEIKFGHVSWPDGTKAVQAMPLPRCK